MRKTSSILLCLTVTVLDLVLPHAALADTVAGKLAKAKADQAQAAADLQDAERRLAELTGQYRKEQARLQAAVRDVLVSYEAKLALSAEVAAAQERLDQQATEAYEAGPGTAIELFLGARTPADFASVQEFEASIIDQQTEAVGRMQQLRTSLDAVATGLEQRQADLTASTQDLAQLADQVNAQLEAARQSARRANVKVRSLQKQQQALERAQAAVQASLAGLDSAKQGVDQSALLALLGPSQGRGCDIPPGLGLAGAQLFGLASWYGWDFRRPGHLDRRDLRPTPVHRGEQGSAPQLVPPGALPRPLRHRPGERPRALRRRTELRPLGGRRRIPRIPERRRGTGDGGPAGSRSVACSCPGLGHPVR